MQHLLGDGEREGVVALGQLKEMVHAVVGIRIGCAFVCCFLDCLKKFVQFGKVPVGGNLLTVGIGHDEQLIIPAIIVEVFCQNAIADQPGIWFFDHQEDVEHVFDRVIRFCLCGAFRDGDWLRRGALDGDARFGQIVCIDGQVSRGSDKFDRQLPIFGRFAERAHADARDHVCCLVDIGGNGSEIVLRQQFAAIRQQKVGLFVTNRLA